MTEPRTTDLTVFQELTDEDLRLKVIKRFVQTHILGEAIVYVLTTECNWDFDEAVEMVRKNKQKVDDYERYLEIFVKKHRERRNESER